MPDQSEQVRVLREALRNARDSLNRVKDCFRPDSEARENLLADVNACNEALSAAGCEP